MVRILFAEPTWKIHAAPMRRPGDGANVELYRAKERALIGQLIVDLLKAAHVARLRLARGSAKPYLAGEIENMLLGWAVLAGHASGKPKNASEVGRYIGVPRVTAQRRLDELEADGIIVRRGNKYHISADLKRADDEYVDKCMLLIKRAAQLKVR